MSQFRAAIGVESVPGRVLGRVKYAGRSRPAAVDSRPLTAVEFNKSFVNTYTMLEDKRKKEKNVDSPLRNAVLRSPIYFNIKPS